MQGTVYKSTGSWYTVKGEDGKFYSCRMRGRFRIKDIKDTNPVAVGDKVVFELDKTGDEEIGIITEIKERKNYIIRRSVKLSRQAHIIAANIDRVFLLVTIKNPVTSTIFIDRILTTAEAYHIEPIILFHKIDLYTEDELDEIRYLAAIYRNVGYTCLGTSAVTGRNTDKVKELMEGKVNLFSGNSGVGKSTLINKLVPDLNLKTAEISEHHTSGKHTTTFAEMFDVGENTKIIDTPGIKGFGLVNMEREEIGNYFPEFLRRSKDCRFNNCLHIKEPGCAVKEALEKGEIFWSRYDSYLQIMSSEDDTYRPDIHHLY